MAEEEQENKSEVVFQGFHNPDMLVMTCAVGIKECPALLTGKYHGPITGRFVKTWCLNCAACQIEVMNIKTKEVIASFPGSTQEIEKGIKDDQSKEDLD